MVCEPFNVQSAPANALFSIIVCLTPDDFIRQGKSLSCVLIN